MIGVLFVVLAIIALGLFIRLRRKTSLFTAEI